MHTVAWRGIGRELAHEGSPIGPSTYDPLGAYEFASAKSHELCAACTS